MPKDFFSGFCLENESELFKNDLIKNDFTVAGFSYGCQKAFEYALTTTNRVDLLQLFSPAFFQNKDKKYKRMQLMYFKKNPKEYSTNFLLNSAFPSGFNLNEYFGMGTYDELDALLSYVWVKQSLLKLLEKGTKVEVYLGAEDKIIDTIEISQFFKEYASVYYLKNAGHILKVCDD